MPELRLRSLIFIVAMILGHQAASVAGSAAAEGAWLVTLDEALRFQGEGGFMEPSALRARSVGPVITLIKPDTPPDGKTKAPLAIVVQFTALADAAIDPASFKVLYGALKVDITPRITKYVQVTALGFSLENAQIPVGRHRLILQVKDEKQRLAERELRFEVE